MAEITMKSRLIEDTAKVLPDARDQLTSAESFGKKPDELSALTTWVMARIMMWRNHRRSNYEALWDYYERLWRAMWSPEDSNKKSEKSTLVTPGIAEAVENIVAEVEEAVFGRGDGFDMKAKFQDGEDAKKIVDDNKAKLKEDLGRGDFNVNVGETLINAAVYGTGIGEIHIEMFTLREIAASVQAAFAPQPAADPMAAQMPQPQAPQPAADPMATQMPQPQPAADPSAMQTPQPPLSGAAPQVPQPPQMPFNGAQVSNTAPQMPDSGGMRIPPAPEATVIEREISFARLESVNPRNFLIEPTARTIDKSLGVAIEEYVGSHIINQGQRDGKYRKVDVGTSAGDPQLAPDRQAENEYVFDKVHIVRYYGLVPKHLLFPPDRTVNLADETANSPGDEMGLAVRTAESAAQGASTPSAPAKEVYVDILPDTTAQSGEKSVEPIDAEMVEAVIVIANDSICIKATENPYLMKDRPVVAFPWDVVPGRFWGRGVPEKGMVPQRVMDAELRARIDALAYISAPMMAMDASRLPRGFQLTVRPGKSILTNGDPNTVLRPMHFGQLEQSTFQHSQQLDQMIQRATGSLDVMTFAQKSGGDARPGAVSMMLSGIVKRHKRTLMSFVDRFYVPSLRKILWRNMQYYPERYTPRNWDFVASGTMGILQREYESANLVQLLQTMDPQSPEYKMLFMGVVANTGLTHRQDIIKMLQQSISNAQTMATAQAQQQSDPKLMDLQSQIQQAGAQLQLSELNAKIAELMSRTRLQDAKARNETLKPQFQSAEIATKGIYQVGADQQKQEFDRRMALTDRVLKLRDIQSNERIVGQQTQASLASDAIKAHAQVKSAAHSAHGTTVASAHDAVAQVASAAHDATGQIVSAAHDAAATRAAAAAKPRPIPAASAQLLA